MPWKVTDVMEQKIHFVTQAAVPGANISALCRESGISRPTGYYWLKRYREADSVTALQERSRRPKHSPRRTAEWRRPYTDMPPTGAVPAAQGTIARCEPAMLW